MKLRKMAILAMMLVAAATITGGSAIRSLPAQPDADTPTSSETAAGPRPAPKTADPPPSTAGVVSLAGLRNAPFGATEQELSRQGVLDQEPAPCGPRLAGAPTADPVFADDRLVLLWANGQTRTPEGVRAGTSVDRVRDAYPAARRLTAPAGTYRLNGLLVREGDRAYLFLHDGRTVRKTVVGYAEYAQKLFDEGFGTC